MEILGQADVIEREPEAAGRGQLSEAVPPFEPFLARGPFFFRGSEKCFAKGVTYGPFRPNPANEFFPSPVRAAADFALMRRLGVNSARVYDPPPRWLADLAAESGIALLVGIPWPEHVCGIGERRFEKQVRDDVRRAVARLCGHPAVLGVLVGNEIPSENVRWNGPRAVERFLESLYDTAKSADPDRLVSYANYPSTEYLRLDAFDFYTLNLYLHDREALRRYLAHARNIAGDRPFVLGEIGIDARGEGEHRQAEILRFSLEAAYATGAAGTFIFSFTDEWFRGGADVTGWSFGLTDGARRPRPAARAVAEVLGRAPELPLSRVPRISVVVATYNGGPTLRETLESLGKQRYPDYEVIVVDDGSTDDSAAIARTFLSDSGDTATPQTASNGAVRLVQQPNRGLSDARNRGIEASTGEIVAFCDSDAAADQHWLYYLAASLSDGGPSAAGVGGPNLPPPGDGRVAAAVSVSPGTATHVLMDDLAAEHIPGCNMAFWKSALVAAGGFDPRFRSAGDDVDVCWRIQDLGGKLLFAPSAIVWHHRRNSVLRYFRQQRGYGEAEANLARKHPARYNWLGGALWRGKIYASDGDRTSQRLRPRLIEYGVFGLGLFQRMYEPGGPPLAVLAAMPEWTAVGLLALGGGLAGRFPGLLIGGAALLLATLAGGFLRAARARIEPREATWRTRALVLWLSLAQPWVRRVAQLREARRLYRDARRREASPARGLLPIGAPQRCFWSEESLEREPFLGAFERRLSADLFAFRRGTAFEAFDFEIRGAPGTRALVSTVMEYHGGPRRLLRVRVESSVSSGGLVALGFGLAGTVVLASLAPLVAAPAGIGLLLGLFSLGRATRWLEGAVLARAAETARSAGFALMASATPPGWWARLSLPRLGIRNRPADRPPAGELAAGEPEV
jgi:glycosyltransferase involved in cell wall biosynthesis